MEPVEQQPPQEPPSRATHMFHMDSVAAVPHSAEVEHPSVDQVPQTVQPSRALVGRLPSERQLQAQVSV